MLALFLIPTLRSAPSLDGKFINEWNNFARPMLSYVDGLKSGIIRADKLREGVRAWHKMERDQGWSGLR